MNKKLIYTLLACISLLGCQQEQKHSETKQNQTIHEIEESKSTRKSAVFPDMKPDKFADLQIINYQVKGFDNLSLSQKKLVYYLTQAGIAGRDIIYDQRYKHNLKIRKTIETIFKSYTGERSGSDWDNFVIYAKRFWFSNGIHHHYAEMKLVPTFPQSYWATLIRNSDSKLLPLNKNTTLEGFVSATSSILFDSKKDNKRVNKAKNMDLVTTSANNFYENVTQQEVEIFYKRLKNTDDETPISYGLNSKLVKKTGEPEYATGFSTKLNEGENIYEYLWCVGGEFHESGKDGLYAPAIKEIVKWLEKASTVVENEGQKQALDALIAYYKTGDLKKFDTHCISWAKTTEGDVDFINGFIEVYGDPIGYRASYESVVFIKDKEASKRMEALAQHAQWFEDNAPIQPKYKKKNVQGVSYKVITVVSESGDAAPSTPIGINLPNANWIRKTHGSKSVSLGNIKEAYNKVGGSGVTEEFYLEKDVQDWVKTYSSLASKMHTAMHEVLGHASGQIKQGVGTPKETLKNYSSTLEEARADLFALYYIYDSKPVELGLIPSLNVGKAEYNIYITNALLLQLRRLEEGQDIEEDHMRNRQLVAKWVYEKGLPDNVIEKKELNGKTYFVINDYEKLRILFGELLKEIQRIKSEGDFAAGQALVEEYGVKPDVQLLKQVKERFKRFNIPAFTGFVQPKLVPINENGELVNVIVEYPTDFVKQMLEYGDKYSFLKAN